MKYLSVKNWETFQHYKERTPPWIKLHRDLLRDYTFSCLQDASKLHLILIWLLASQLDNKIPADADFIKKQIGVSGEIDFNELISKGFLIDASGLLAGCKQVAILETETETETETYKKDNTYVLSKKNKKLEKPDDVSQSVWDDFITHRKSKKATVTETVLKSIRSESEKIGWTVEKAMAEMCARGWQGFKAQWIINEQKGNQNVQSSSRNLTKSERADIALGITKQESRGFMDGPVEASSAPIFRYIPDLR